VEFTRDFVKINLKAISFYFFKSEVNLYRFRVLISLLLWVRNALTVRVLEILLLNGSKILWTNCITVALFCLPVSHRCYYENLQSESRPLPLPSQRVQTLRHENFILHKVPRQFSHWITHNLYAPNPFLRRILRYGNAKRREEGVWTSPSKAESCVTSQGAPWMWHWKYRKMKQDTTFTTSSMSLSFSSDDVQQCFMETHNCPCV
jgi:hypothetical protein